MIFEAHFQETALLLPDLSSCDTCLGSLDLVSVPIVLRFLECLINGVILCVVYCSASFTQHIAFAVRPCCCVYL